MSEKRNKLTPEVLVPRLGDHLVKSNLITPDELQQVLSIQKEYRERGETPPLLGSILVAQNKLKKEDLDQAVTIQIIQLRKALEDANQQLEQRVIERTAELQRALDKLSELNTLKSNFISNISHELRTPLTHLVGYIELFISGALGELNTQQIESMLMIKQASGKLESLIQDLIQMSIADKGEIDIHFSNFDIVDLANQIIERYTTRANQKQITLSHSFSSDSILVNADPEKITWVIEQLLDNGIKFNLPEGLVTLSINETADLAHISISDTGVGITEQDLNDIFEPFHQLDGSSTRKYGGIGLGLALVKKIITAHGSKIQARSEPGKGSEFLFSMKKGHQI